MMDVFTNHGKREGHGWIDGQPVSGDRKGGKDETGWTSEGTQAASRTLHI